VELHGLLNALDPTWVEHGHRVQHLSAELGRRLGMYGPALDRLEISALLHDIGKAQLDQNVLSLPRPLTPGEWEHVQQHPQFGYDMLTGNVHDDIAAAVLAHHERFDGTGYPHRILGPDIPLAARILAVADAYDAIVSDRVYDGARTSATAVAEITAASGTQFDPLVVEAFCDVVDAAAIRQPLPTVPRLIAVA
jgi:HD-GYP domain-containing protein (c-di-GMP phosphodiesterase class II)